MNKIFNFYQDLLKRHGHPKKLWPQWCATKKDEKLREIVVIGAVLTQRTSWRNADLALRNLKRKNLLCLKKLAEMTKLEELRELKRLVSLARFVNDAYTKRLVENKKWAKDLDYDFLKEMFERGLPKDVEIYQNYHALIIVEQKGRKQSVMEVV